ncbi:MAG TPA: hypothetical protein VGB30_09555 [bacterium]|jgi:hypothetical protein
MKTKELPDIIRYPLGIITGLLSSAMFYGLAWIAMKISLQLNLLYQRFSG